MADNGTVELVVTLDHNADTTYHVWYTDDAVYDNLDVNVPTIALAITSGVTGRIGVSDSTYVPNGSGVSGIYAVIDNEVVGVSGIPDASGITLNLRGALGTSASLHDGGAAIRHVNTVDITIPKGAASGTTYPLDVMTTEILYMTVTCPSGASGIVDIRNR